jgi:ribosomal protein S18 acetylase RimI-like enzyme
MIVLDMSMTIVRQYNENDRENVIALWKICDLTRPWNDPDKDFDRKKGVGEDLFMVLEYENKIIGTLMGGYDGHRGVMNYLAVDPNFRGHGFGKILVEAVEDKLKNRGCPKINLLVRSDNIEVSDFYEGLDYKKQGDVSVFGKRLISDD